MEHPVSLYRWQGNVAQQWALNSLLPFCYNSGYVNAPHCFVTGTLPILLFQSDDLVWGTVGIFKKHVLPLWKSLSYQWDNMNGTYLYYWIRSTTVAAKFTLFSVLHVKQFSLLLLIVYTPMLSVIFSWFLPFVITHCCTVVSIFCDWFRRIGRKPHDWRVGFLHLRAIARITLSSVKLCLLLSEVNFFTHDRSFDHLT